MKAQRKPRRERPVMAALLTLVMTLVWVTLPIGQVVSFAAGETASLDDISLAVLRAVWLGIAAATIPAVALSRIPRDKFLPRWWRVSAIFLVGMMTLVILFDRSIVDQPPAEPSADMVLTAFVAFGLLCGPALWFNVIKPVRQRRRRQAKP